MENFPTNVVCEFDGKVTLKDNSDSWITDRSAQWFKTRNEGLNSFGNLQLPPCHSCRVLAKIYTLRKIQYQRDDWDKQENLYFVMWLIKIEEESFGNRSNVRGQYQNVDTNLFLTECKLVTKDDFTFQ
ncbi:hypothetical protein WN51_12113 [Melipona quadrifasciata]|uniref:Uncharacterized protein n=1 Tax=Melipona quadrifasciata TaxID=166423 RepID=A0A0N0U5Z4_9HYME|nr:hypothetical protein WN51_12113 [Melipona quadrifasciata]